MWIIHGFVAASATAKATSLNKIFSPVPVVGSSPFPFTYSFLTRYERTSPFNDDTAHRTPYRNIPANSFIWSWKQLHWAATFSCAVNVYNKIDAECKNKIHILCRVRILFREWRMKRLEKMVKIEYYHYLEIILNITWYCCIVTIDYWLCHTTVIPLNHDH